ncbi:MAG TPA: HEAT repeat domain-containing protein [Candidatus Acidoferrales bacterium]|nr:HEAT repeat domain-containing protein [Candidatus Acidoferrales bacterium]
MGQRQSENSKDRPCGSFEPLLMLYAAGDELDPAEHAEVTDHLLHCADCREVLECEKQFLSALAANRSMPDASLLASCRNGLMDALDRSEDAWLKRWVLRLAPVGWLSPRPAWSAGLLLLLGFSVGMFGPRLLTHESTNASNLANAPSAATKPSPAEASAEPAGNPNLGNIDLHTAEVAGINVLPATANQPPEAEIQLRAQQPVTLQGTVDDASVKRVLLNILRNNERFDADVRISAVELLRARNNDPDVRSVLCHAVHTDRNAAVRLKALEALNGAEPQDIVRQTLLDALVDDQNPGVRIEAINSLRDLAAKGQVESDDHMIAVLRDRMEKDPSTYIRLQSAAAIRDLGPRQKF